MCAVAITQGTSYGWWVRNGITAVVLSSLSTTALAQPTRIDCDSIRATTVPVQLHYKSGQNDVTYQVYRGTGGSAVLWSRLITPYLTIVVKAVTINGFATETDLTSFTDKVKHAETKQRYVGIQIENDDRRHSEVYKVYWTRRYGDGSRQDTEQDVSYAFQSTGEVQVGPCVLLAYRGETSYKGQHLRGEP